MKIDEIREQIAEIISTDQGTWDDVLNDTSPNNYGCDHWDAEIDYKDIFVNVPERTFTVKNGNFSASLIMGSSKGDHSFNESYSKPFSAEGTFGFKSADQILIEEIKIDISSDIYAE